MRVQPAQITMEPVLHSLTYGLEFLREQVQDLDSATMISQPNGLLNHPAWTIGHLAYVLEMLGGVIGLEPWLPEGWAERYGSGSVPRSDAAIYERKDEALEILDDARIRIIRAVELGDDHQLDKEFPDEQFRTVFPTVRHALTQVLVGHTAFHVGQISVWRRAMGLPPMSRSFE